MKHTNSIHINRDLVNWEWYSDTATVRLYLHLLLSANVAAARWRGIDLAPSQLITSPLLLRAETGLSAASVKAALQHISDAGFITVATIQKHLIITVLTNDSAEPKSVTENNPEELVADCRTEPEPQISSDTMQEPENVCVAEAKRAATVAYNSPITIYNNVGEQMANERHPFDCPRGRAPPTPN